MRKIILSLALVSITFATAQKKEISSAYKAIESGDNATAVSQLSAAESLMGDKTYLLEPEILEQYYYTKGLTLMNAGKTQEGAAFLAKINDLGKTKIYTGKNENRDRVYYVGKEAADKSGISNLKEETYTPTTSAKLGQKINPVLQATNKEAVDAYNSKDYALAGDKFKETYYLLKAAGTDDKSILKNAAISYAAANKLDESIILYNDLIDSGYTGVETTYLATNKKDGKQEKLDKNTYEIFKKAGAASEYKDFTTETSPSIEKELYQLNARNLYNAKRYDEAIALSEKGLKKFPGDATLMNIVGLSYFGSGKSEQFIAILRKQLEANPKDYESWYNLGVMLKSDPSKVSEAEDAFNKALEIKPNYVSALQNLTFLKMGDDQKMIDNYNAKRKAGKIEEANKILAERRAKLLSALPYAEKWYAADPNNVDVVTLLKGLYLTAKNDAKAAEFKAKEEALRAKEGK
ncbi:hypothetical protein [Halpernia sp.]|uniref:hypothetical protein n=1 Tax=Halpernia sp. TaxID=2782209 RepID=UPI003A8D2FB6